MDSNKEKPKKKVITQEQIELFKTQRETIIPLFKEYYKDLLCLSPKEYEEFLSILIKDLPITFRISKINSYCECVEEELYTLLYSNNEDYSSRLKRHKFNFLNNIYELDKLSKDNATDMKIKELLIRENDLGILRQELVAMIPVNLVNIEDDHIILDMCAAPGNKSVQILEIMEEKARTKGILPRGVLISNEYDHKRADNLSHFLKTQFPINSIVINAAAQDIPLIKNPSLKPDIVFCDVPCSGDGTLRKNKGLRKRWRIEYAYQNYPLQLTLLNKAIKQCKVGGYIVYSTCSINPIENEAVVRAILEEYEDSIELVNVVKEMNEMNIKFSEGLIKWKVCIDWSNEAKLEWACRYDQVKNSKNDNHGLILESMFDDVYTLNNHQNSMYFNDPLCLRRCVRIYSHDNNSGSFFIAVIKKKSALVEKEKEYSVPINPIKMKTIGEDLEDFMEEIGYTPSTTTTATAVMKTNSDTNEGKEDDKKLKDLFFSTQVDVDVNANTDSKPNKPIEPLNIKNTNDQMVFTKYVPITSYPDSLSNIQQIFKFKSEAIIKHFYCFRETSSRIFLISEKMVHMLDVLTEMNINVIKIGMIAFKKERQKFNTKYRMTYYGVITLEQMIERQTIEVNDDEFIRKLFEKQTIAFNEIPKEIYDMISPMENGTIILIYNGFIITCRKGKNSICLFIPKAVLPSLTHYVKLQINKGEKQLIK